MINIPLKTDIIGLIYQSTLLNIYKNL